MTCPHEKWYWSNTWLTWKCVSCGQRKADIEAATQQEIPYSTFPAPKKCMTCGELLYPVEKMSGVQWNHETSELAWHCQELLDALNYEEWDQGGDPL